MALDTHAHLHHAPAEDDDADGLDAGEDKVTQVIHNGQGIAVGVGRAGKQRQAKDENTPQAQDSRTSPGRYSCKRSNSSMREHPHSLSRQARSGWHWQWHNGPDRR